MTDSLDIADFSSFFQAINGGARPFPWQVRLAQQVHQEGRWPSLLDLPTGSGKTAALDVAVFLRALGDDQPRRIVFVVDRRVIVHQAFLRAQAIARELEAPIDPTVAAVARRLRGGSFDRGLTPALVAAELRGGIPHDETWAMRPDVPAVLVSTVDQVGSRLLFRGYGVSRGMRPVHAGLLGNDVVFMLDEVHLARPFAETLRAVSEHYRHLGPLPDRWQVVELSATPTRSAADRFQLQPDDRTDPVLDRRLSAEKPVVLSLAKGKSSDTDQQRSTLVDACADRVRVMADLAHVRRIGVVVNRVATAVAIYQRLAGHFPDPILLTGRMRPFDREDIDAELREQWLLGRDRAAAVEADVLVSTQAIEAGADLDLDGLVTECAPLDALVQRFGRVDRDGLLSKAGTLAPGFVITTDAQRSEKVDDPVYGSALARTWRWLDTFPDLDFGPDHRPRPTKSEAEEMRVEPPPPPVLLPVHLRAWAQTSPPPHADPDPDLWLHGLRDRSDLDVSIVWRQDLGDLFGWDNIVEELVDWVAACSPTGGEAMAVPIGAARTWLTHDSGSDASVFQDVSDVEGAEPGPVRERRGRASDLGRPVLLWRADDQSQIGHARDLRPGDTIVVPSSYGGVTAGSWDPQSRQDVVDLGTRSQEARKGRIVLRLVEALLPGAECPSAAADSDGEVDVDELDQSAVREWLRSPSLDAWRRSQEEEVGSKRVDPAILRGLAALASDPSRVKVSRLARPDNQSALVLEAPVRRSAAAAEAAVMQETVDSEPDTSSFIGQVVTLNQHLRDVSEWAAGMARKCGMPSEVVDDLALAGEIHDLGKADPRFQQLLQMGRSVSDDLLAKSDGRPSTRAERRLAQRQAGYPDRCRHELLSTFLASCTSEIQARAHDWDLVLHLVTSHHGHGRPGVPVAVDDHPVEVSVPFDGVTIRRSSDHRLHRLDAPVAERFWEVTERYGWYGLAWLEAILRLADHRASAERQGDHR